MIARTYPEYRDAKVEWLPKIPVHWQTASLRWLSRRFSGGTPDKNNQEYWAEGSIPWLNSGAVNQTLITEPSTFISASGFSNSSAKWIPAGALVMALAGQGKTKGMVAQLAISSTCNQSMAAIVPTGEIQPRFLLWWLHSNYQNIRNMAGGDMRDGLNLDLLGEIACPLPSSSEQSVIANFLDQETAKIDALVEEQRCLIELLKEKRQAVISQAVTKGLNPNAPTKESGVEWLGKVPAHWGVGGLGYLAAIDSGATPDRDNPDYWNGNIPWIKTGEVNYEPIAAAEEHITEFGLTNTSARLAKPGTLLMAMYGQGATRGRVSILEIEAAYNQACAAIRFRDNLRTAFGYYFLLAAYEHVRDSGNETSQMNLSTGVISKFKLPVPPLHEQDAIVSHLDQQLRAIDGLLAEARAAAQLLGERRAALISAAVTGKIDVRGLAPSPAP